jgi:autotransporter-associated beta strand protein
MRRTIRRLGPILGLILSIALLNAAVASAQTTTWSSNPADNLWSNAANWTNGVPANAATADVHYGAVNTGNANTNPVVDTNNPWEVGSITFNSGASAFNQSGNAMVIDGISGVGIANNSTNSQIINNAITLGGAQNWNATSGNLTFGGAINNNGNLLTIDGASNTTMNGAISGAGGLTKNGAGTLLLNSANTFSGPVTINNGTMTAGANGAFPTVDYTIPGGTLNNNGFTNTITSATLTNGGAVTVGTNGNLTVNGQLSMEGTSSFNANGGTASVGSLVGNSTTTSLTVGTGHFTDNSTGNDTFGGLITINSGGTFELSGGSGSLTLTNTGNGGAGTLGTVQIDTGKTLTAGADGSLPTATYDFNGTAALNAQGHNFTVTGLTDDGAGTANISLGSAQMTIAATGTPTYTGTITGATSGSNIPTIDMVSGTQTLDGAISGSTKIVADGGTLILGGVNTYTGGTTLNGTGTTPGTFGTVAISADNNLGGPTSALTFNGGVLQINGTTGPTNFGTHVVNFSMFNGGIDVEDPTATFTITQALGSAGNAHPLLINPNGGDGTVILANTSPNAYSTTIINSGTLQVGTGTGTVGSLGTGAVTDNGNLTIDHNSPSTAPVTISNNLTGTGTMLVTGGHTLVLTGANALTGATTIDAGNTLKGAVGNIPGDVIANGTLDFTQATDATYSNTITGAATGHVIKDSAGTLTFSGTNNYAGDTTINAGRLDITGTTTSTAGFTVAAKQTGSTTVTGGTLGGTGTISGNIVNNGTVSPGTATTPLATLTQSSGNYTGNSGSTFVVNVNGAPGTNSELAGTGTATLNAGSNVHVNISGSNFTSGATYTAIDATAATRDAAATIDTNEFFVKAAFVNSATDIQFTLTQNFVPTNGATFNQRQLGTYLNTNMANTNTDFQAVLAGLTSITNGAEARAALTQITGDIHPTMAQVSVNNTQIVIGQVAARLRASNFTPGGPMAVADGRSLDGSGKSDLALTPVSFVGCDENGMPEFEGGEQCCRSQWSGWGIGYGMGGSTEFGGNATSASFGMGGVVAGMEHWEDDCHLLGLYGAYVGSGVTAINGQQATMNGGQFGAYMFGDDGFNYYTVLGGFEFDGDTTNRNLAFGTGTDAITDQNSSSYSDWQGFAYAERGMSFEGCNHVFQPFVGLQYIFVRQDAFTETGGSNTALDLAGSANTTNSLRSTLGARMQYAMTNHGGRRTLPEVHALWVHEFLDTSSSLTQTMVPIGNTPFIVQGLDVGRDWALVGGNFTWEMLNGWGMFVNYDLQTNARTTYHVGSGGLGYRW